MRKLALSAIVLINLIALPLQGQVSGAAASGRAMLDQAVSALGGEAFLKLKTERVEGRVYSFRLENLTGLSVIVEYVKYPDKRRDEYGKKKEDIEIINGDKGWDIDIHGVKPTPDDEMKKYKQQQFMSGFHILRYRLGEPGSSVEYAGRDFFDNREVDLVNFIDSDNETVTFALDRDSHLPVRVVWVHRDPKTRERLEEAEILSNYLTVQGITAPHHLLRKQNDRKTFEAFIQQVEYNLDLPDSLFNPPAR